MLARIRKMQEENEGGFTLIELLVVIIIIGILAAIAIPVFLNQRKKGVDASEKSDVRTVANQLETYFTDFQAYPASISQASQTVTVGTDTVTASPGNTITYVLSTKAGNVGQAFCVQATNTKATHDWVYVSNAGGLQAASVITCPAAGSI
jgi:type IV pilus assembly protein PilA